MIHNETVSKNSEVAKIFEVKYLPCVMKATSEGWIYQKRRSDCRQNEKKEFFSGVCLENSIDEPNELLTESHFTERSELHQTRA
jgi:hypothetical protein